MAKCGPHDKKSHACKQSAYGVGRECFFFRFCRGSSINHWRSSTDTGQKVFGKWSSGVRKLVRVCENHHQSVRDSFLVSHCRKVVRLMPSRRAALT